MPFTLTVTNGVQSHSVDLSANGLHTVLDALEVGADGFGQTDSDDVELAEQEAWLVINALKLAIDMPTRLDETEDQEDDGEDPITNLNEGILAAQKARGYA